MTRFFRFINAEFFNKVVLILQIFIRRFFLKGEYFVLKIRYLFRMALLKTKYLFLKFKYFFFKSRFSDTSTASSF
jgi:hypothetical protein